MVVQKTIIIRIDIEYDTRKHEKSTYFYVLPNDPYVIVAGDQNYNFCNSQSYNVLYSGPTSQCPATDFLITRQVPRDESPTLFDGVTKNGNDPA